MHLVGVATRFGAVLAEGSFTDPENARTIYLVAGLLVAVAVALAVATVVWWRRGATEHPALGPLEVMSTRQWRHADYTTRLRELDEARPEREDDAEVDPADEPVDLEALVKAGPPQFDDLVDPLLAPAFVALAAEGSAGPVAAEVLAEVDVPAEAVAPAEVLVPAEAVAPVELLVPAEPSHDETASTDAPVEVGETAEPAAVEAETEAPEDVEVEASGIAAPIDPLLRTNAAD